MRIGLFVGVTGPITFADALAAAQHAERADLDSLWLPNIDFAAAVYGAPEERDRTMELLSRLRRPG